MLRRGRGTLILGILIIGNSCQKSNSERLFQLVSPYESGIDFENRITENDSVNVVDFQYLYNGGGVGIGDFDNDGFPDIVFTGNQVPSRIYLNRQNLKFEDITELSGFITDGSWITGVSIVDINSDGLQDIYLNVAGSNCESGCHNLLFVNEGVGKNGIPKFREQAKAYGLDDEHYSQQSIFFDFDGDGDLDVFILRNGNYGFDKNNPLPKRYMEPHLNDQLLRNDFDLDLGHPYFTDVSKPSGIIHGGFGLGVGINDINNDGLVDIYVANDFITDDLLYIQKRHQDSLAPWFEEQLKDYIGHTSHNSMGMDFSDINNDALPDILVVDMLPQEYTRQKKMLGSMNYERYQLALRNGYSSQYVRNTLQINNGSLNDTLLRMSEVGFLFGLSSTDWSWAPLMLDLDNDGDRDIYISNGYVKDVTDLDYINYSSDNNMFGSTLERLKKQKEFADKLKGIYIPNYIYENNGNQSFIDVSKIWVDSISTFTNGVAYADLDKDGDLDLILNNINETAFILENKTSDNPNKHYLRVKLKGTANNANGIGAKIWIWQDGQVQHHFQSVIRGYLSSVEPIVHFGIRGSKVDSVVVRWSEGSYSLIKNIEQDKILEVDIENASKIPRGKPEIQAEKLFNKKSGLLDYVHTANSFNEFAIQPLLMKQYAQSGPCIAVANVDSKKGDEIFIGGNKGTPGTLWAQDQTGVYRVKQKFDSEFEDTDAVFVDIDGDNDLDLYITSGGYEFEQTSESYNDRIYLNDGTGVFKRSTNLLSDAFSSTHIVRPFDFDNDGDMDFFIGSRIVPGKYPMIPESRILVNKNGRLVELENSGLKAIGMVSDALWEDIDCDGLFDLVVVGEWMPIRIFKNNKSHFTDMSIEWVDENHEPIATNGWWNCIAKADFDNDGDIDFLIGNQGWNSILRPFQDKPVYVYKEDFDKNGSPDPLVGKYFNFGKNNLLFPLHSRDDIVAQLPVLKRQYLRYDNFTKASFEQLLDIKSLELETLVAYNFASSYAENLGNGKFRLVPLPSSIQVAPVRDILIDDFDNDGNWDALIVGNDFSSEAIYGRHDALTGMMLKFEKGVFKAIGSKDTGFYVPGQSSHIAKVTDNNGKEWIIASQNKDSTLIFSYNRKVSLDH